MLIEAIDREHRRVTEEILGRVLTAESVDPGPPDDDGDVPVVPETWLE